MVDVKPIRTEADYEAALEAVERLWGAKSGTSQGDRLDVLVTLIEAYEEEHHPIDPPDPVDAILFRMDQMGLTRKDLERILGSRMRVSEVLRKKRPLSLQMIRNLYSELSIPAEVLIGAVVQRRGAGRRRRPASRAK